MPLDLIQALFSNVWAIVLVILFFSASVFVHELGHFLVARARGLTVTRFSIGFGPPIYSWKGQSGTEYRFSWIPLGGYVALPQIADMPAIEGEGEDEPEPASSQPVTYTSKVMVFVAGAIFNVIFAFLLASIVWFVGIPTPRNQTTTQIGSVSPTIVTSEGETVEGPAMAAGIKPGDHIVAVDGIEVSDWDTLVQLLVTSAGRTEDDRRVTELTIDRYGERFDVDIFPRLATDERIRRIGVSPVLTSVVGQVTPDSAAAAAGLETGTRVLNTLEFFQRLGESQPGAFALTIDEAGETRSVEIAIPAGTELDMTDLGLVLEQDMITTYPNPVEQVTGIVRMTFRTLGSLINPQSDIGISKLSGPVGIFRIFHLVAKADLRLVLWFTILVNINLAIFNLLPIPVLDGGHILIATINKLRGRDLPANWVMTTQSVFMMLLLTMILYVSFFDVRRIVRDNSDPATTEEPAEETPAEE